MVKLHYVKYPLSDATCAQQVKYTVVEEGDRWQGIRICGCRDGKQSIWPASRSWLATQPFLVSNRSRLLESRPSLASRTASK